MKKTYKTGLLLLAAVVGLAACGKAEEAKNVKADPAELTNVLNGDLSTAERNCIAVPVKFEQPVEKDYAKLTDPNGAQLDALVKANLIKATPAEDGKVTFSASDAGKEFYSGLAGAGGPGFCAGEVSVASIVDDKVEEEREKFRRHLVTYQYKFEKLAPWQSDAGIRAAFPQFAAFADQAGKQPLKSELTTRGDGWNVSAAPAQ
ncbi:hypothetical protein SAMN02745857_00988 [Andreprevotia lacus DSM 23236]|jgi:hypothetical protein|uniref:Lipoprotein n=1 Tax=Andreprevotia lacus DSM 23236 TaxID=1121001 RepID=A0A1W1X9K1_9NEIS|nr:hypothetical protein [Andreprevotia lacus]SMC20500.1 hypothetical protein SAMN02745857_00988 [Andreprevotia lacus DSM 23236]